MKVIISVAVASLFVTLGVIVTPNGGPTLMTLVGYLLIAAGLAVIKMVKD